MPVSRFARLSSLFVLTALAGTALTYGFFAFVNPYLPWEPDASLNPDANHTHADFAVWFGAERLDFSKPEYMSGLSADETTHDEPGEVHDMHLHLHDGNGDVIHRHKPGLTLGEFFASLGMTFTTDCFTYEGREACNGRMFINGREVPMNPGYVFQDLDHVLLSYDSDDEAVESQLSALSDEACLYSKACPWRGDPPTENCIADPEIPCVVNPNADADWSL